MYRGRSRAGQPSTLAANELAAPGDAVLAVQYMGGAHELLDL
jgi:hypothetical protein